MDVRKIHLLRHRGNQNLDKGRCVSPQGETESPPGEAGRPTDPKGAKTGAECQTPRATFEQSSRGLRLVARLLRLELCVDSIPELLRRLDLRHGHVSFRLVCVYVRGERKSAPVGRCSPFRPHIYIDNCHFRNVNPSGRRDALRRPENKGRNAL